MNETQTFLYVQFLITHISHTNDDKISKKSYEEEKPGKTVSSSELMKPNWSIYEKSYNVTDSLHSFLWICFR